MSDRCLNLRDWEARAMLAGASVLVRPVKCSNSRLDPVGRDWPTSLAGAVANTWHFDQRYGWIEMPDGLRIHPLIERGDTAILREAWRIVRTWMMESKHDPCIYEVEYRVDGKVRSVQGMDLWLERHYTESEHWRSPQTMPAALARIRRRVVSVEPGAIESVSEAAWKLAGCRETALLRATGGGWPGCEHVRDQPPSEMACKWWERTYGPGSWAGWVWVMTVEEVSGESQR